MTGLFEVALEFFAVYGYATGSEFGSHNGRSDNGRDRRRVPIEAKNCMTKPFNEYACLRDCLIRWHYGEIATGWPVPSGGTRFEDMHLLAVSPPVQQPPSRGRETAFCGEDR